MKAPKEYRKLSGPSSFSTQRLYAGSDHILAVDGQYEEHYKRFFYKDIQALCISRTKLGAIFTGVLFCFLATATLMVVTGDESWKIGGYILGTPVVILLIIHLLRGPTCDCRVKTAVQFERLRTLNRLRKARRVVEKLTETIHEAQGEISREELLRHVDAH